MKKIEFTDGSFVAIPELNDIIKGDNTFGIPYVIWFSGYNFDVSKTDKAGNTWRFISDTGVRFFFNGAEINPNPSYGFTCAYLFYDNDNNNIGLTKSVNYQPPHIGQDNGRVFRASALNGNGTGGYDTIALMIARGQQASVYSNVSNIITDTVPFTATVFTHYPDDNITHTILQAITDGTAGRVSQSFLVSDSEQVLSELKDFDLIPDPYEGAGDSGTGGGGGTFDGSSDPVPVPPLPSVGATNTGFISLFVPTQTQLKQVADYLWSPALNLDTFKKIFENPMDCILGLSVVPVTVPTSGSAAITVGNVELSGIYLPLASQQYVEIDCGSIPFTDKFFGSYLDQDPYTKMALFVPYSGVHSVKADDIMGKTVNLKYHIDILTGSLVAFLTCGSSVLYEFNGACASNIPVNSMNYASTIENAIRIAVNIGTTVATAGASAPMTGAATAAKGATDGARLFGTAVNMAGSTAEGILSLKPNIDRAGSLGGTTGLMGNQIPYFIITRPRLCKPANQNIFKGYPSFIQVTLSDLIGQGYTEFDSIVLAGLYLTDGEKEELKQILESGVYL